MRDAAAAMRPGERLPSSRELMARYGVSPVTVSRALALLSADGVIVTRPGSGTYVANRHRPRQQASDYSWQTAALGDRTVDSSSVEFLLQSQTAQTISLAGGYPHPSLLPTRALAGALARAVRRPEAAERPPLQGVRGLRAWFARAVDADINDTDVLITSGGQAALSTALRAIVPAGAPILVESPSYIGVLAVARGARMRPIPVPVDAEGLRPELLAEAFARTRAQALFCQPTFQNPTGASLSAERRAAVLSVARDAGAFVIEDDYARWLAHQGRPPRPLIADDDEGHVVHIASLTKVTSPNLRVGALIARGPVAERLRALRIIDDFFVPRPVQEATLELVSGPGWPRHLKALSSSLLKRREAIVAAVSRELPHSELILVPAGGLNLWLRLPSDVDDIALAGQAREAGILVSPGRPHFAAEPPGPHIRLSFAATPGTAQLEEGVRQLARLLQP